MSEDKKKTEIELTEEELKNVTGGKTSKVRPTNEQNKEMDSAKNRQAARR